MRRLEFNGVLITLYKFVHLKVRTHSFALTNKVRRMKFSHRLDCVSLSLAPFGSGSAKATLCLRTASLSER